MVTETQKTFQFHELDEEIQKELIEKHRHDEVEIYHWYETITECWKDQLENLGFEDAKIYFSGFWSQGDGACFTAIVDLAVYLPRHKIKVKFKSLINEEVEVIIKITHSGRYYYATSTDVNIEVQYYGENNFKEAIIDVLVNQLEKHINKERERLGQEIYKELQDFYEDLISDKAVKERLSQYNFNKFGGMI